MTTDLRSKVIRLAKENPELRSSLLPLLKTSSSEDDNPYQLYGGHEKVTERISDEIATAALTVASAYKTIKKLIEQNAEYGTRDSEALLAIWGEWDEAIKKAMRGKT